VTAAPVAAIGETTAEDAQVRITRWTFPGPGAGTGTHQHELDYVVVPITGGTFTVTDADGTVHAMTQAAGVPYVRAAGATHDVVSTGAGPAVFVEIELKP
jgi:hypothetical protein